MLPRQDQSCQQVDAGIWTQAVKRNRFREAAGQPRVYRHESVDVVVIAGQDDDEPLLELGLCDAVDNLIYGLFCKLTFSQPIRLIHEKYLPQSPFQEAACLGACLTNKPTNKIRCRGFYHFCRLQESHIIVHLAHLSCRSCFPGAYEGKPLA